MEFSLFYFDGDGAISQPDKYRLLLESAQYADQHGFTAVWTPERHFHAFGGLYSNPAVTSAALATLTRNLQVRAGSVVVPLHHPVRIAEEWAVVDNLSNGRAGVAFASGWTTDDFVLSSTAHARRKDAMWQGIEMIQRLWAGETVELPDATGKRVNIKTLPRPLQTKLPIWITSQSPDSFRAAGQQGHHVLTALFNESVEGLTTKIKTYRASLAQHGRDPQSGRVTLMTHTYLGAEFEGVKAEISGPFCNYLKSHYDLLDQFAKNMGLQLDLKQFSEDDIDSLLQFGLEGFLQGRSLIGTPETCRPFVEQLRQAGVDEIACLIDFNPNVTAVMESLPYLKELQDLCRTPQPQTTLVPAL